MTSRRWSWTPRSIEDFLKSNDPAKRGKEIEITLIARLRKHFGNPKFTELGERLEKIKERHEYGPPTRRLIFETDARTCAGHLES